MKHPDSNTLRYSLIPLTSSEPLWEWDLVTDAFYLSQGARISLNLHKPPDKMSDFYKLLPPEVATELASMREGVISGITGSTMDCGYLCNGLWVHETLLVLSRNSSGRATRIMGRLTGSPLAGSQSGFQSGTDMPKAGLWTLDVAKGLIWQDKICAGMLGYKDEECDNPTTAEENLLAVHPAERKSLSRHYELFCDGPFLGDNISDIVRVRCQNGDYIPLIVRASIMARDADGKATLVAGSVVQSEPRTADRQSPMKDERLSNALNNMGSGQWNWDMKNDVMYFCPRYLGILGYTEEMIGNLASNWRDHIHPDDMGKVLKAQLAVISSPENGDTYECTYRMARVDGTWAWIFDRGYVTWRDMDGSAGHMIGTITNITTAQAERDRLEELVRHDSLTGLRSRAFYDLEMEHVEQNRIRPVCIISVDITGLKMINDSLGHAMGDELLTKAATLLRKSLRTSDCIARVGGDEFLILLPNCDYDKGKDLLEKIEIAFDEYNKSNDHGPVFAACGVAAANDMTESLEQVAARADEMMYENKKSQRATAHAAIRAWIKQRTGREPVRDDRLD